MRFSNNKTDLRTRLAVGRRRGHVARYTAASMIGYWLRTLAGKSALQKARRHFGSLELSRIVTAARDFPITSRVDVYQAIERAPWEGARLLGVHFAMNHETPTLAHLFTPGLKLLGGSGELPRFGDA